MTRKFDWWFKKDFGRVARTRQAVSLREKSVDQLWFRGGYPEALTLKTNAQWYRWAENYFTTFIRRDVNFLMGETMSPSLVDNLWQMLSAERPHNKPVCPVANIAFVLRGIM